MNPLQRTRAWHKAREGKLTASNFGQAAGIAPGSRQQLWRRIKGLETIEENEAMAWGTEMEDVALDAYREWRKSLVYDDGSTLIRMAGFITHPNIPWIGASPDLLLDDVFARSSLDGVGEIKCPFSQKLYDVIPTYYMAQIQGLMEVTDREFCHFICWTPQAMRVWEVKRSREYWQWLEQRLTDFWSYVEANIEPPRAKRPTAPDALVVVGTPFTVQFETES